MRSVRIQGRMQFFSRDVEHQVHRVQLHYLQEIHESFEAPPAGSIGSYEERLAVFRRVRHQLQHYLREFPREPKG